jgi:uncharacterized protein YprB with RNaseH-like and TPR domain
MFLDRQLLKRCLFIDIETVSEYPTYDDLPEIKQMLWDVKASQIARNANIPIYDSSPAALYIEKAGIFSEFAKVVTISMGFLSFEDDVPVKIRIKSLAGSDESRILEDFSRILINHYNDPENNRICGHNIKEFDIPFLCRRMVINQIQFPPLLDISGKKPWQTAHILDTMDMWRFGDYKNYTSLNLLAGTLGISSPKDDIDGSMVGKIYWENEDVERIVTYCQKDVVTVIQVVMKFAGLPLFDDDKIEYINVKE